MHFVSASGVPCKWCGGSDLSYVFDGKAHNVFLLSREANHRIGIL